MTSSRFPFPGSTDRRPDTRPFVLLCTLALAAALAACGQSKSATPSPAPVPVVEVVSPARNTVRDSLTLDGVVAPSESVDLVARVAGYLQSAPFREGERVRRGQLLFVIEPAPYREQVKLNEARVAQADAEAQRQQTLMRENATAQSAVDSAVSNLRQAEASLALARISLGYTQVRAPFDGVIGRRLVDEGNYVGSSPGGTVLATVTRLQPAYVDFSVNEGDWLRVREEMVATEADTGDVAKRGGASAAGSRRRHAPLSSDPGLGVPVRITLGGQAGSVAQGELVFVDHRLGQSTGTLALRARFDNGDGRLIPGLYARTQLHTGPSREAWLVPTQAVQTDQQGRYLYVLGPYGKVARQDVTIGGTFGDWQEVRQGLAGDERVIVGGIGNVTVGQEATARLWPGAATAPGTLSPAASASAAAKASAAAAAGPVASAPDAGSGT